MSRYTALQSCDAGRALIDAAWDRLLEHTADAAISGDDVHRLCERVIERNGGTIEAIETIWRLGGEVAIARLFNDLP